MNEKSGDERRGLFVAANNLNDALSRDDRLSIYIGSGDAQDPVKAF